MHASTDVGWNDAPKVPRRAFLMGSAAAVGAGGVGAVAVALGARRHPPPQRRSASGLHGDARRTLPRAKARAAWRRS